MWNRNLKVRNGSGTDADFRVQCMESEYGTINKKETV